MPLTKQQNEIVPERLVPIGLIFSIDVLLTSLSFTVSYLICSNFFPEIVNHRLVIQLPIIIAITSLIFLSIGIYRGLVFYDRLRQVYSIFNAICLANVLTIVFAVINGKLIMEENLTIPLSIILVHSVLSFITLVMARFLYKYVLLNIKEKFVKTSNVVLVHNFDDASKDLTRYIAALKEKRKNVIYNLNFREVALDYKTQHLQLEDNYVEGFVLASKENDEESYRNGLEKLAMFKRPIYTCHFSKKTIDDSKVDDLWLSKFDLSHLFSPRLNFQNHMSSVKNTIGSETILITGAGGTIAKEYIRCLIEYDFKGKLILLDNSEASLNSIFNYCQTFKSFQVISKLGDAKDQKFVERIFEEHRPEYVLHAAGNNKPEFFDDNILNVFKENVLTTKVIADLAAKFLVKRFIFCSNAEAALPKSTLEVCKRVSELYLDSLNTTNNPFTFISLRMDKVFDFDNSFINYLQWQIDLGRGVDTSKFGPFKVFSNKRDVANTLLHITSEKKPLGSVLMSGLGLKIKTSILVDFMVSLGPQRKSKNALNKSYLNDDSNEGVMAGENFYAMTEKVFDSPPLKTVPGMNGVSKSEIKKTVETICFNILLNSKHYPEVFSLIQDFEPGHWNDFYQEYLLQKSNGGVIRLKK